MNSKITDFDRYNRGGVNSLYIARLCVISQHLLSAVT